MASYSSSTALHSPTDVPWWRSVQNRAAVELLSVVGLMEIALWGLGGPLRGVLRAVALVGAVAIIYRSHQRRRRIEATEVATRARTDFGSNAGAWMLSLGMTFGAAIALVLVTQIVRVEGERFRFFWIEKGMLGFCEWIAVKSAIIVGQQLALNLFLVPCFADLWRNRQAARLSAALVFGIIHLPSAGLVLLTSVAAYGWSWFYERTGRLTPIVISHLMLAILAHAAVPERLNCNMRVGASALKVMRRYNAVRQPEIIDIYRFVKSDHYYARCGGADRQYINHLYAELLRRPTPAKESDVAEWIAKLANHSRADVASDFLTCPEFQAIQDRHGLSEVRQALSLPTAHQPRYR